jgi:hypothetical protein
MIPWLQATLPPKRTLVQMIAVSTIRCQIIICFITVPPWRLSNLALGAKHGDGQIMKPMDSEEYETLNSYSKDFFYEKLDNSVTKPTNSVTECRI